MAKPNQSKYAVLGMLSFAPMSGYDIKANFEKSINHFWLMSYTQIYAMLKRLEKEGHVNQTVEKTEGRPDRRIYSITETGQAALKAWICQPPEPIPVQLSLSLKLFYGHEVDIDDNVSQLEAYQAQLTKRLVEYEAIETTIHTDPEIQEQSQNHPNYILMTLRRGIHMTQAQLDWCDESLEMIEQWQLKKYARSEG